MILSPKREVIGRFECFADNRPGRVVSGDFFDVIALDKRRIAVTLGDVAGKGLVASVLMTVAVGFLRSALQQSSDPARALAELNHYLQPRCSGGRFMTLWAAVLDADRQEMIYTDAGHGYAFLIDHDGTCRQLNEGGGVPVGKSNAVWLGR